MKLLLRPLVEASSFVDNYSTLGAAFDDIGGIYG